MPDFLSSLLFLLLWLAAFFLALAVVTGIVEQLAKHFRGKQ